MVSVSGVNTAAVQPLTTAERVRGQKPEEAGKRPLKPVMDEYVPEEKREPSGRYWLGKDADGRPRVYFDDPEQGAGRSEKRSDVSAEGLRQDRGAEGREEKAAGKKAESCVGSTDKVDGEIEKLKRKQEELKRQLDTETDETRIRDLERKLAQVEGELRRKDNDAYRRQHTEFS